MSLPIRRIKPEHLPQLETLFNQVFGQWYLRLPVLLKRDWPHIYYGSNIRNCYGAFDGGKLVAHTAARPVRIAMEGAELLWASYGNVMTHPDYRGRHLASRLNRLVWGNLKKTGVDGVYISGGASIYQRMGATHCGNYSEVWLGPRNLVMMGKGRTELTVRPCRRTEAGVLVGLHRNETTGFRRREFDYHQVLTTGWAMLNRAWPWLVMHRGTPLAYALVGPEWTRSPRPTGRGHVVDYAGSRSALFLGLPKIMKKAGYSAGDITVGGGDRDLLWLMRSVGAKGKWHGVHGTQIIINPSRLFKRLHPYFVRRLGDEAARGLGLRRLPGGKYEISLGSRRHRLDGLKPLTRLILGAKEPEWTGLLPGKGPLRDSLRRIFPIPFPHIGLNWM